MRASHISPQLCLKLGQISWDIWISVVRRRIIQIYDERNDSCRCYSDWEAQENQDDQIRYLWEEYKQEWKYY